MVCLDISSTVVWRLLDALVSGLGSSHSSNTRSGDGGAAGAVISWKDVQGTLVCGV